MIQIDMPMPKNCYDCPCGTFDDIMDEVECNLVNDAWFIPEETAKKGRLNNCPLKEVPDNGGWISVKDRMPGNNKDVLICGEWTGASGTKYRELFLSGMEDFIYQGYTPIAWMPLPEPPKEE